MNSDTMKAAREAIADLLPGEVPVLRTCAAGGVSHGGFIWPTDVGAVVEAPDWNPKPSCGGGLHGLLRGEGDGSLVDWSTGAVWMVLAVAEADIVDLNGKVKFPRCRVIHAGNRESATIVMAALAPGRAIAGVSLTGGDSATLTGGDNATLTGGDYATLTGGNRATLTGGDGATLTGGNYATLTGGDDATLTGGNRATLTGGDYATLTGGDYATLTGGDNATLSWRVWDSAASRIRIVVAYVGEDGIKAGTAYRLSDDRKPVEVTDGQ